MNPTHIKYYLDHQASDTKGKYPGLGLVLRYMDEHMFQKLFLYQYPIGAHPSRPGAQSRMIMIRELAMMDIMEKLTDEKHWHEDVFKDDIVAKWRDRILAIPDKSFCRLAVKGLQGGLNDDRYIEPELLGVCIEELRQKAKYFAQSGIVPTLDACASVVKSDSLVNPELHEMLRNAFQKLKADQASSPDWHPGSNGMVQNLVDPLMYPLVYDRSRVYQDEVVGVADAITSWAGKGSVIARARGYLEDQRCGPCDSERREHELLISREAWSEVYQGLPSNVAFTEDGSVRFTSYINNLHPNRYGDIYRTVEKLVQASIPMWDQCLLLFNSRHLESGPNEYDRKYEREDMNISEFAEKMKRYKWEKLRKPVMPEPVSSELKVDYMPKEGAGLIDLFSVGGLQVIVKMVSIELTPEKPPFPADEWHIEGTMNECICATSLYYLDSENITISDHSFRMHVDDLVEYETGYLNVGYGNHHWLQQVYGSKFYTDESIGSHEFRHQYYGAVETREGRLLAFPNVFHNRGSGFQLDDPSKPGHQRFIALFLVDPTRRIISTANVPPQQMDWWVESIFDTSSVAHNGTASSTSNDIVDCLAENGYLATKRAGGVSLPPELTDMIKGFYHDGESIPMQVKEAQEHRLKAIRKRRIISQDADESGTMYSYSL
ncbi:hypothetical protein BU24DRAFT_392045 [Aaosphaeria arxii CBS 175.79]|uniref:Uncharacterized protein n=1 Tax=Aaosphaeria arxii CBS 175.79 TaxID=1450172 RepID=A0A6A5XTT5_9PLEO|nr:uncharacterized protein BU24DRAFT_392045 [Aaosphaeria arxii CBS 175.79]KAF2016728.1 hypothetical protein BU24DRAFT_392045 [Aaosphaeria arxii CBS 175.79]